MLARSQYKIKPKVKLKNKLSGETVTVDVVDEESIEGKQFWVVRANNRTLKLSKDAYTQTK